MNFLTVTRATLTIEYDDGTIFTSELSNLTSLETEARRDTNGRGMFTGPLRGRIVIEGLLRSEVRRDRDGNEIASGQAPMLEGTLALSSGEEVDR
jgi:hypothetical protein